MYVTERTEMFEFFFFSANTRAADFSCFEVACSTLQYAETWSHYMEINNIIKNFICTDSVKHMRPFVMMVNKWINDEFSPICYPPGEVIHLYTGILIRSADFIIYGFSNLWMAPILLLWILSCAYKTCTNRHLVLKYM